MENNSHYDQVFTDAVYKISSILNLGSIRQQMKEIKEKSLISALEQIGNNEHIIQSIKEKGLPKVVFCSKDKLIFCAVIFNFCKVIEKNLLDSESILLCWLDPDDIVWPEHTYLNIRK